MSKKSYDQRLNERWRRREQNDRNARLDIDEFYGLRDLKNMATAWIMPFLFGIRRK